jgi:GNAT superfamily N-acetyltransferase
VAALEPEQAHLSGAEPLARTHDTSQFDCGRHESLTNWLKRMALMNQASGDTRTFVVHRANRVAGYYSLAPASIARAAATRRAAQHAPDPIPVVLLARLAVDKSEQGRGLGRALLKDALIRAAAGAEMIGGRAVLVHAIDDEAAAFYRKYGFEPCPASQYHLMLLMKDLRRNLGV